MRRATFTNHALLALLTAFVVDSALGESPEQTKIRITTWNLEWFPNGSAHDAAPQVQAQRIAAAANVLRPLNPDIVLLQEVRDYEACARLGEEGFARRSLTRGRARENLLQPSPAGPLDKSHTSQGAIVDLYLLDGAA